MFGLIKSMFIFFQAITHSYYDFFTGTLKKEKNCSIWQSFIILNISLSLQNAQNIEFKHFLVKIRLMALVSQTFQTLSVALAQICSLTVSSQLILTRSCSSTWNVRHRYIINRSSVKDVAPGQSYNSFVNGRNIVAILTLFERL